MFQERPYAGRADDAALFGHELDGLVCLVAAVLVVRLRIGMGYGHGLVGDVDGVHRGGDAYVREVYEDSDAVHLLDRVDPEVGEAAVLPLHAAVSQQIALVVRDLGDAYSEAVEQLEPVEAVLDRRGVLPAEDDSGLALALGSVDVLNGLDLQDAGGALTEPDQPPSICGRGSLGSSPTWRSWR